MYIDPFIAGIIVTILLECALLIGLAIFKKRH